MHSDSASVDLTDRCQPTATGTVLHMLRRVTSHDETTSGTRCVAHFTHTEWAVRLECETWSAAQVRNGDLLCVRRTQHRRSGHVRIGLRSQDVARRTTRSTCNGVASESLTDRCRPTVARMVPYMLEKAADRYGTIRWPPRQNFSEVVLADHQQAQMDHQRRVHAKTI